MFVIRHFGCNWFGIGIRHDWYRLVFGGVRVVYSLVFYVVSCIHCLSVCLFYLLAMALSVYFRFMSLTVPLLSFVSFFIIDAHTDLVNNFCT